MPGKDPMIGAVLGSYEIIQAIGEGGMARIYKGYHADLKRYAAVKVVNWGLQEDPEFTKRFRREAQAVAALRHPNIVQIFDFGKYTAGYFMAMEFIDGPDLAKQLHQLRQAQKLLPKDKITRIVKDVAAALDYEVRFYSVEHQAVVKIDVYVHKKIFDGYRCLIGVEFQADVAEGGAIELVFRRVSHSALPLECPYYVS